jgi:hypothetical protein
LSESVQFDNEFEVLVFAAEDFLENSGKITKTNQPSQNSDKCKTQ